MKCKKEIMGLAALMIVLYHFYIPFGNSAFETYLFRSTFVGVDMFFFVSAYSLASRNKDKKFEFGKFILNRLSYIYAPFVFLAIVAAFYNKWTIIQFVKTIFGIEFFNRGGGSFLWYFIGIMLIYLLTPLFDITKKKLKIWGFPALIGFWLLLSVIFQFVIKAPQVFILINRLPIFFIGLYYDELIRNNINKLKTVYVILIEASAYILGTVLAFKFATTSRLNKPFADIYYVVAIPLVVAIIMIVDTIVTKLEGKYKSKVLNFIGGITMELYGLQMVFGYDIEMALLKVVPKKAPQLAVVGTLLALIIMAYLFNLLIGCVRKALKTKKADNLKGGN